MKTKSVYMAAFMAAMVSVAACSDDKFDGGEGEGTLTLRTSVSSDMAVESRAVEDDLKEKCQIWISKVGSNAGLVRKFTYADMPDNVPLLSGDYVAEAWTGDSVSASFSDRWFKAREEFTIRRGQNTPVELHCNIANVAAAVSYQDGIEELLSAGFTMDVEMSGVAEGTSGCLTFENKDERTGYFMKPSEDAVLRYSFKGRQAVTGQEDREVTAEGTIENILPGHKYILSVKYSAQASTAGGLAFSIIIDDQVIEVPNTIVLTTPPVIKGYDFDISETVNAIPGAVGDLEVYVSSATEMTSLEIENDNFNIGGDTGLQIIGANADVEAEMNALGIRWSQTRPDGEGCMYYVCIENKFTETFAASAEPYVFNIIAENKDGGTSKAALKILISDAAVEISDTEPVVDQYRQATVYGRVRKDGLESVGFNYRKLGDEEWTYVEGSPVARAFDKGSEFYAVLDNLELGAVYEYAAVTDGMVTDPRQLTTLDGPQLPNAGFETWGTSGKATVLTDNYENNLFWDCGNHGSATMNKNVTTADASTKHSGEYSARLESQFVGIGIAGKFAAGNVFVGKYLKTDGTDGVLGWGREFEIPAGIALDALKAWVKYTPAAVTESKEAHGEITDGSMDKGILYIALMDDYTETYDDGSLWARIVKTKSQEFFDKNSEHVIAYGEMEFTQDSPTSAGMVEVTIPLEYRSGKEGVAPKRLIIVGSASKYGDYFAGGRGSTMWLDDLKLVYR